jgi:hypothetical protein
MADTYTTNLNLTKPEPGAAEDTWGISLNADLDALDAIFSTSGTQINLNPNQVNFADNKKAIFGTGSDLSIYHSGTNSHIADTGEGNLYLDATNLIVRNGTGTETYMTAANNGGVVLYHDNTSRFSTTSTGIDVTGTVVSDGLTVANSTGSIIKLESTGTSLGAGAVIGDLQFYSNDASFPGAGVKASITATTVASIADDAQLMFSTSDGNNNNINRLLIANNGDISFYDDTGTTQGLFWDASAERLGLGTTSPSQKLSVSDGMHVTPASAFAADTSGTYTLAVGANSGGKSAIFDQTIVVEGSVGIGTDSPDKALVVEGNSAEIVINDTDTTDTPTLRFRESGTTAAIIKTDSQNLIFTSGGGSEAGRFDTSGSLLAGKTSADFGFTQGFEVRTTGNLYITTDDTRPLRLNRLTSDGELLAFRKDGSDVGSIGTRAGDITIGTGDTGLRFSDGNDAILPAQSGASGDRDAAIDLGVSSVRFKDLYLSGGLCGDTTFKNSANTTEYARFNSSGNLLVGTTAGSFNAKITAEHTSSYTFESRRTGTGSEGHFVFRNANGAVGTIFTNGSATAYNTSSDARLKDVTGEARGLEVITKLNPVAYNWKADGKADEGLIAQEVKELVPNAVTGSEDEHYQMDYSKLVTHLVKAVQELEQQTIELKKEIANLKGEI